jgi:hypothetical protein
LNLPAFPPQPPSLSLSLSPPAGQLGCCRPQPWRHPSLVPPAVADGCCHGGARAWLAGAQARGRGGRQRRRPTRGPCPPSPSPPLQACPRVQLLRLGSCPSIAAVAELVLGATMPRLREARDTELQDDWEAAGGRAGRRAGGAGKAAGRGTMPGPKGARAARARMQPPQQREPPGARARARAAGCAAPQKTASARCSRRA